jgi:hypothetical protein
VKTRGSVAKPAGLDLIYLFEHDLRTSASRLSRAKTGSPVGPWPEGMMLFRIMLQLLLAVLGQVLIAQVPVLPQLQGRQQHH